MFGFRGKGHFGRRILARRAIISNGRIFCTEVYEVEFHVLGFKPPGFTKASLLFEGNL